MHDIYICFFWCIVLPLQPGTKPSPSTVLPSVKILAFKVNFGVIEDVKMLVTYLRCFPNVETLHIEVIWHPMQLFNRLFGTHITIY